MLNAHRLRALPMVLGLLSCHGFCQGRPPILWMRGLQAGVTSVQCTPDGQGLFTSGTDGVAKVRSLATGQIIRSYPFSTPYGASDPALLTPDGQYCLCSSMLPPFGNRLVRISDGAVLWQAPGGRPSQISPDGRFYLCGGEVLRMSDGSRLSTCAEGIFSPNSQLVISKDGLRRASDGRLLRTYNPPLPDSPYAVSPDSSFFASRSASGIYLRRLVDGSLIKIIAPWNTGASRGPYADRVQGSFSPNGSILYNHGSYVHLEQGLLETQFFEVIDIKKGVRTNLIERLRGNCYGTCEALSVDRTAVYFDGTVAWANTQIPTAYEERYDVATGALQSTYGGPKTTLTTTAWSPDSRVVAASGFDGVIWFWNAADGTPLQSIQYGDRVTHLEFSPDGTKLLASGNFNMRVYDLATPGFRVIYQSGFVPGFDPLASRFMPDGNRIAIVDNGEGTYLVSLADGSSTHIPLLGDFELQVSWDGTLLTSGTLAYNLRTQRLFNVSPTNGLGMVSISPDRQYIAVGKEGMHTQSYGVFDANTGLIAREFPNPWPGSASDVFFPNDGVALWGAASDGVLRAWDTKHWDPLAAYTEETGAGLPPDSTYSGDSIRGLSFSPDATMFAYGRSDATIVVCRNPFHVENAPIGISIIQNPATGGRDFLGTITLANPAPLSGLHVPLKIKTWDDLATISAFASVGAGAKVGRFTVSQTPISGDVQATVTAMFSGHTLTENLVLEGAKVAGITPSQTQVMGGGNMAGTVTLNAPAGPSTYVSLSSSDSSISFSSGTCQVPFRTSSASFTINTRPVATVRIVTIYAGLNGATKSATITLLPAH